MNLLEKRIASEAKVIGPEVISVASFLNHQIDVELIDMVATELHNRFTNDRPDRILTIEASGIAVACAVARLFRVPMVFAKKSRSSIVADNVYSTTIHSFTHGTDHNVIVSREFLPAGDRVLIVDDFLASGAAVDGLMDIVGQAGCEVAGIGVAIEKGFMDGGRKLRELGYKLESVATIESMDPATGDVIFRLRH